MDLSGSPAQLKLNRTLLFTVFFFAVFLYLLYQLLRVLAPFISSILGAAFLAIVAYPLHGWMQTRGRMRPGAAAGITTAILLLMVIIPMLALTWFLIREASAIYPSAREWIESVRDLQGTSVESHLPPALGGLWSRVSRFLAAWQIDPQDFFLKNVNWIGDKISGIGAKVVKNLFSSLLDLFVLIFALFFFLRDGPALMRWLVDLIPMEKVHKQLILQRLDTTLSAVVRGVFVTAAAQGLVAGIGFTIVGIKFSVLLGFATSLMAMVPFLGAASVWVPVCIYLFVRGPLWAAFFLLGWSALFVSMLDNFMKPILIGGRARLPTLLLFFGTLGGLQVYGFLGILIGPLLIASILSFIKIYREAFQQPPEEPVPGG